VTVAYASGKQFFKPARLMECLRDHGPVWILDLREQLKQELPDHEAVWYRFKR